MSLSISVGWENLSECLRLLSDRVTSVERFARETLSDNKGAEVCVLSKSRFFSGDRGVSLRP